MIKRKRSTVNSPISLDPKSLEHRSELAYNKKILRDGKGSPWADLSSAMKFEVYTGLDVKPALSKLFGNKCAYCEASLDGQDLHTEHFRPKAKVANIDHASGEGYWWLAATWENLLPACLHCNRSAGPDYFANLSGDPGKGNRFPLLPLSKRARKPGEEASERHCLLDPTIDEPAAYLSFNVNNGESLVVPLATNRSTIKWKRAAATIEILNLNRSMLVRQRNDHLRFLRDYVDEFIEALRALNEAKKMGTKNGTATAKRHLKDRWCKLFDRFLAELRHPFLHASIRYIEERFIAEGLSFNQLSREVQLHIPRNRIR
jgi:uncharacterized protein (TIGR02646 family)